MVSKSQSEQETVARAVLHRLYGEQLDYFDPKRDGPGRVLASARHKAYKVGVKHARDKSLEDLALAIIDATSYSAAAPLAALSNRMEELRFFIDQKDELTESMRATFGDLPESDTNAVRYLDNLFRVVGIDPVHVSNQGTSL